jgi:cation diffusion facilitator CzcD-associated flavoprotein CzcO
MSTQHFDIIIIGAGLSGIDAACHFKMKCHNKTFTIFEGRSNIGGTWDLFKYPGIRSDSDMHTFSYSFKPWNYHKSISDAETILKYLKETAEEYDLDKHIQFDSLIQKISWSSKDKKWTVKGGNKIDNSEIVATCSFIMVCTGYYDYEEGYTPKYEGLEKYKGQFVHPQKWTTDIEYENKNVVVIGSGATAVTIIPSLARKTKHITMLQRSPTYVISQPLFDPFAKYAHKILPSKAAHFLARWKNILRDMFLFRMSKKNPDNVKKYIKGKIENVLGKEYDIDTHFNPKYNPWDERLCSVPDNDLFNAIKNKECTVVTDHIETFTEKGILLKSGKKLEADLIISATGLSLKLAGGMEVEVDGEIVIFSNKLNYKGSMVQDIPNLAAIIGYTNAAWTLKADLVCLYVCRLLNYMDDQGFNYCVPRLDDDTIKPIPIIDFSSGYILRSMDKLPKQGDKFPWKLNQNYLKDRKILKHQKIEDDILKFEK